MTVKTCRQKSCLVTFFTQDEKHSPYVTLQQVQAEALFTDKAKDVITLNSCSAAGQGFYKDFCPGSKSVRCLSNSVYVTFYYQIFTCFAQLDLCQSQDWRFWSMEHGHSGEMCFYISDCFEAKKTIGSLKVNTEIM